MPRLSRWQNGTSSIVVEKLWETVSSAEKGLQVGQSIMQTKLCIEKMNGSVHTLSPRAFCGFDFWKNGECNVCKDKALIDGTEWPYTVYVCTTTTPMHSAAWLARGCSTDKPQHKNTRLGILLCLIKGYFTFTYKGNLVDSFQTKCSSAQQQQQQQQQGWTWHRHVVFHKSYSLQHLSVTRRILGAVYVLTSQVDMLKVGQSPATKIASSTNTLCTAAAPVGQ